MGVCTTCGAVARKHLCGLYLVVEMVDTCCAIIQCAWFFGSDFGFGLWASFSTLSVRTVYNKTQLWRVLEGHPAREKAVGQTPCFRPAGRTMAR